MLKTLNIFLIKSNKIIFHKENYLLTINILEIILSPSPTQTSPSLKYDLCRSCTTRATSIVMVNKYNKIIYAN